MKILEAVLEFIFSLIKKAILIGIIAVGLLFTLLVFTIYMPDQVINAFQIIFGLVGG